ncbi:hypothetical protein BJ875DRAFT_383982 [Amylocarpus encephaloides]|uniref:Uncharacterized protein n=1 Tax=Amylocarpus encephaloides TaxID=45428 RepID=A0A9P8C2I6_9HELO|nr:hypothetical protein BJ875DRAFT_383982 [Amylocarpus encephaloides]
MPSDSDRNHTNNENENQNEKQNQNGNENNGNDQSKPGNPFIKFRQFADLHIGSVLQGIIGLPSAFSKNTNNTRWADVDDDLRRRDELQARQQQLKDADAQQRGQVPLEQDAYIPIGGRAGLRKNSNKDAPREIGGTIAGDIQLYSPVRKSLFSHLRHLGDNDPEWKPSNLLNGDATLCSDYSLLPYLLFSSYSPLKLSIDAGVGHLTRDLSRSSDRFPYYEAFEDLIKTAHGRRPGSPIGLDVPHLNPTVRSSMEGMSWIERLYGAGILQQKEARSVQERAVWPSPWSCPVLTKVGPEHRMAETEQDMYDLFLRSASAASVGDIISSVVTQGEAAFRTWMKEQDSPEELSRRAEGKDDKAMALLRPEDQSAKIPQDSNRVVSSSTTTEHYTNEDGFVETTVTVWRRFADGRESHTTTSHCEDPPNAETDRNEIEETKATKKPEETTKKGWFWN